MKTKEEINDKIKWISLIYLNSESWIMIAMNKALNIIWLQS